MLKAGYEETLGHFLKGRKLFVLHELKTYSKKNKSWSNEKMSKPLHTNNLSHWNYKKVMATRKLLMPCRYTGVGWDRLYFISDLKSPFEKWLWGHALNCFRLSKPEQNKHVNPMIQMNNLTQPNFIELQDGSRQWGLFAHWENCFCQPIVSRSP